MDIEITLKSFYSMGDERRFFQGLKEISSITEVCGVGRNLIIKIQMRSFSKDNLRELLALLWRYSISLAPLKVFADKKKFLWLNDSRCYWYKSMFKEDSTVVE